MKLTSILAGAILAASTFTASADEAKKVHTANECAEVSEILRKGARLRELGVSFDDAFGTTPSARDMIASVGYISGEDTEEYQMEMRDACMRERGLKETNK